MMKEPWWWRFPVLSVNYRTGGRHIGRWKERLHACGIGVVFKRSEINTVLLLARHGWLVVSGFGTCLTYFECKFIMILFLSIFDCALIHLFIYFIFNTYIFQLFMQGKGKISIKNHLIL